MGVVMTEEKPVCSYCKGDGYMVFRVGKTRMTKPCPLCKPDADQFADNETGLVPNNIPSIIPLETESPLCWMPSLSIGLFTSVSDNETNARSLGKDGDHETD
jgi:hypothetical protein